ncbi:hypothetical protein [Aliiroseovarius sp. 2305UL8-7]|uniref:hypothetical protein n=1 Tax=Aliiroseovarius conchicola TaxID=3121637 RepID=UPI0035298255
MSNGFIFIQPPSPEELVRTYLTSALRNQVHSMQRNLRSARMMGRIGDDNQIRAEFHPVVLNAMLEHGLQKTFPTRAIDPT